MRRRLLIASNRGPVEYRRDPDGTTVTSRGAGGLVAALRPLVDHHDVTWVASAPRDTELLDHGEEARTERSAAGADYRVRLVPHDPEAYRLFYTVAANPVLWFVLHGLTELLEQRGAAVERAWAEGYREVNRALAEALLAELRRTPEATLLVQDYHLMCVAPLIRARVPHAAIAHFSHTPWASPDEWRSVPPRITADVHEGLLACDNIGFHTERWRTAFVDCCDSLLGRGEDAERQTHVNPVPADAPTLEALAGSAEVAAHRAALRADRPAALIVRADRTDPAKNAVRGFQAFGLLLDRRPDLHGRVSLLALLDPSRQEIPEYSAYRVEIERAAAAVCARHGGAGWAPVVLEVRDDLAASVAAYLEYDVLLVNPVRDGLNLVAKEAPLVNERHGVVVLSREAGAFAELEPFVIATDPFDLEAQAASLERALALGPADRARLAGGLADHVRSATVDVWASRELEALDARADG